MIPDWYERFWCPDEMYEVNPWGCGFGLGLGLIVLFLLAAAVIIAIALLITFIWPDKENRS